MNTIKLYDITLEVTIDENENIEIIRVLDLGEDPKYFLEAWLVDIMISDEAYYILHDYERHTEEEIEVFVLETMKGMKDLFINEILEQLWEVV